LEHPLDLTAIEIPALLRQLGLRPDKRLGQNFLIDPVALQRVVQAAQITPQDRVLEVGAGLGSLTRLLAQQAREVVAVEIDHDLIPALKSMTSPFHNIRLVEGDILQLDPSEVMDHPDYLIVANIPYYITSALLRHLLEASLPPRRMVMTVQLEVADRICAQPGEMSLLALSVQVYGKAYREGRIPAGAFYPVPKVDSAIVRIDIHPESLLTEAEIDHIFLLAKSGFGQKRKKLRNALASGLKIEPQAAEALLLAAGIQPGRRAESLSLEEWVSLSRTSLALSPKQECQTS
jgi:16S rRNA (adenine1518-N6/adenine1519-N6)-dimethyltransferase